jgi:hypothetical protein
VVRPFCRGIWFFGGGASLRVVRKGRAFLSVNMKIRDSMARSGLEDAESKERHGGYVRGRCEDKDIDRDMCF